jgi:DNA-binding NarL/FixJ family response regulator
MKALNSVEVSTHVRILIADDYAELRKMLSALLNTHAGWQVCGEAANGLEAVKKAAELKPDVIILDLSMPEMDGLKAASQISLTSPDVPIVIYTNYAVSPETKLEAKKHGVREIINKGASPDQLLSTVESVLRHAPQGGLGEALSETKSPAGHAG